MKKKVIIITGVSSGIGRAISEYLGQQGHTVFGLSRSVKESRHFKSLSVDVNDKKAVFECVDDIATQAEKIDVLINNAGLGIAGPIELNQDDEVLRVLETNVLGVMHLSQAVLPIMRKNGSGKILNISSIGSIMGLSFRGVYCASKAAVDMITEALRLEVKRQGIQVCLVHPGDVKTEINENRLISSVTDPVYADAFRKAHNTMNEHVNHGIPPESFGPLIHRIIHKKKLKSHYYQGHFTQKLSVRLKRLLPAGWFERILMKYYEI